MAITGKKKNTISKEEIFARISPYDVFMFYYPGKWKVNVRCHSPFTNDNNPSMIIGDKFEELTFKCFNSDHRGDCIDFVRALYSLSYVEALQRIASDFGLIEGGARYKEIVKGFEGYDRKPKKPVLIQAVGMKCAERHIKWLESYSLDIRDLNFCKDTKVMALKEWSLNRRKMPLKSDEVAFVYNLENELGNWLKIYRPEREKEEKWKSSIPFNQIHGLANMHNCDLGILTKSIKDGALLAKYITPCTCVIQAEDITAITKENMEYLKANCKDLYISLDSDRKGVESSISITKAMGVKHINPPKKLLERGITDWADWVKADGIQPFINYFKTKIK